MKRLSCLLLALFLEFAVAAEPQHIRGDVSKVEADAITVRTAGGKQMRLPLSADVVVISLAKASFAEVGFGSYVGAVAVRRDGPAPGRPHKGLELRIVDEPLRGIELGLKKSDRAPNAVIAHGWVDDIDERVVSIKYGPGEREEMDVDLSGDVPILKMSVGDRSLIKPGTHVFANVEKGEGGGHQVIFILVGQDSAVPPL